MKINKLMVLSSLLVSASLVISACGAKTGSLPGTGAIQTGEDAPAVEEKQGETSKTGAISESNGKYYLQATGEPLAELESYSVDLSAYVGKVVTVTGQYSGDTLFVGSVK